MRKKGIIALIVLAGIWGSMGIFSRYLNTGFTVFQQVYLRLLIAGIIGLIVFKKDIHPSKLKKISLKEWILLVIRAVMYYSIGISLYTKSVILTKLSNVIFIDSLPTTAILGFLLLREKITWQKILYTLLAFLGVMIIGMKDFDNIFSWGTGETIMFVSVWCTALSMVIRKFQTNLLNNKEMTLLILFIGSLITFIFSLLYHESLPIYHWTTGLLLVVVLAGAANTAITYLINYGFEKVDAVLGSNILTLQTIFAIVIGFLVYQEVPLMKELIGGALIVYSVIKMNKISS